MKKRKIKFFILFIMVLALHLNYENNTLQISNYKVESSKIGEFDGYKIIQISDFHNNKSKALNDDIVKAINRESPDIIVITGDFIDKRGMDIDVSVSFLEKIINVAPIYFVPGNHEASSNKYSELKEIFWNMGVNILDNRTIELKKDKSIINLMGIEDPSFSRGSLGTDEETVKFKIDNIIYNKEYYTILLFHRPEVFETYVNEKIDLVFTGHAHGGQIRVPFVGGIIAPNQGLFPRFTSGVFDADRTKMIVSRGIGKSIIPFRVNNRPELVIVTLKNKV